MTGPSMAAGVAPFERLTDRYEAWFETHPHAYLSELAALGELLGRPKRPIEVGVGTGRFADALGVPIGVEPARAAGRRAHARGLTVVRGVGEALPLADASVDLALIVTTICFFEDDEATLAEVARILEPGGHVLVGMVDRETPLGKTYETKQAKHPFYRPARFHSAAEVLSLLTDKGFKDLEIRQTIFDDPEEMDEPSPVMNGYGEGGFVAIRGTKPG